MGNGTMDCEFCDDTWYEKDDGGWCATMEDGL